MLLRRTAMLKRAFLSVFILMVFVSFCSAEMTIYFKDGKEVKVTKIVFKGDQADLYLTEGTIMSVSVAAIDLDVSGIGKPVGTYGETSVSGNRPAVVHGAPVIDTGIRQAELRQEWENATVIAVAKKDVGSIRKGDTVHAYSPDSQSSSKTTRPRYYWYDDDRGTYVYSQSYSAPVTLDQAYMIVYKKTDGTFGKKIMDAAGFATDFDIQKPSNSAKPIPIVPLEPHTEQQPAPEVKMPPETEQPENQQPQENVAVKANEGAAKQPVPQQKPAQTPVQKNGVLPWVLGFLGLAVVLACAVLLFLRSRKKPFVDTSKFAQCERDMREFEIEIWLRHGKTMDQLMEICLKKFYQDQPAPLNVALKISKRTGKSWVLPFLIKEAGVDNAQAEQLYSDFESHVTSVRKLIEEVSARKGIPIKADVSGTQPPARPVPVNTQPTIKLEARPGAPPAALKTVQAQPVVAAPVRTVAPAAAPVSAPSSITSSAIEISLPIVSSSDRSSEPRFGGTSDLPSYVTNLLDQLAFLSNVQRK